MMRDSMPLRQGSGGRLRAARAFWMFRSREARALADLCPEPRPPMRSFP